MLVPLQDRARLLLMRRPRTYKVPANTSDGYAGAATWDAAVATSGDLLAANMSLGRTDVTHYYRTGMRFFPVLVPNGVHIAWAKVRLNCDVGAGAGGSPVVAIRAEDADDAAAFGVYGEIWTRARGAEEVAWSMEAQTANLWYSTPDIATVIQAVINRPGWVSGAGLAVYIDSTAATDRYRIVHTWNEGAPPGKVCPELLIQL